MKYFFPRFKLTFYAIPKIISTKLGGELASDVSGSLQDSNGSMTEAAISAVSEELKHLSDELELEIEKEKNSQAKFWI